MDMKKSSFIFGILVGALVASVLMALVNRSRSDQVAGIHQGQPQTLKIAHSLQTNHPVHEGILHFQKRLETLSGGSLTCTIYPNGQLGKETEYLEKLQSGNLDLAKTSAAPIGNFIPRMKVFSLPYLFNDRESYWKVLDGKIGIDLLSQLSLRRDGQRSGIRGLCYFDAGSRNFYAKVPIQSAEDLKGRVIRVMNDPVAIDMIKAFKGTPKPMAGGEIYSALEKGVIDGAENNPPTFMASSHYEVCKHFTFDHHSRIPDVLLISEQRWNTLNQQQQSWITTAASEASEVQRALWKKNSQQAIKKMQDAGVTIYHPEIDNFREAIESSSQAPLPEELSRLKADIVNAQTK